MKKYGVNELRKMYLEFFESKGHLAMKSFSLVPHNDNSLLLINAGMAPLKPYFTGQEIPPRKRVTTCQKCIRTGDIENVGKTARHGTFFEMLGNFSFGDYFKHEAIAWSWEFLTEVVGLDADRLYPSVYLEDDEAFAIWRDEIGIAPERIFKFGKEDNFWEHGAGPCGPCSEIYYDRGEKYGCGKPGCTVGCDCDRYMEVWNNVFTQFENDGHNNYTTLKQKNIDTGMGLERLAVIVQDVGSIFDVDTIRSLRDKICEVAKKTYKENEQDDISIRLITDHIRSATFMISDGIMPSNEGRGYVLRRIIRRAARHGRLLGIEGKFLAELSKTVIEGSKDGYPELEEKKDFIYNVIIQEEGKFNKTIDQGLAILADLEESMKKKGVKELDGQDAFKLYDTYGFPLDLTKEILEEKGYTVNEEAFQTCMNEQKEKARSARKTTNYMGADVTVYESIDPSVTSTFVGYETQECDSKITVMTTDTELTEALTDGQAGTIFVDETPFYATGGGQHADSGVITCKDGEFIVEDVVKMLGGKIGHIGHVTKGMFKVGDTVTLSVNKAQRADTAKGHSATHLLQKSLRTVLGNHVEQSGSYVDKDRLRFDFSHFQALTAEELAEVEKMVNEKIAEDLTVSTEIMSVDEAKNTGAMALFGEKYGDKVSYDFPIVINSDGNYEFNFTSDASRTLFMTNLFGKKMKKGNVDYSNASAAEVMDYCVNSFFDLEGDYDMEMTLKIIAIRYNIFQNSYQKYVATTIATNISKETMTAIYENEAILTGVSVAETTIRRYVDSEYFAPLIGYTGKISESELQEYNDNGGDYISSDYVGKSGIEAAMEDTLQGVRGEKKIFVDSTGKVLSTVSSTDPSVGKDVTLTIDKKLQIATYKMLEKKIASVLISQIVNRDVNK